MKRFVTFVCIVLAVSVNSQTIQRNANTIIVKGVSFEEICSALLDSGYQIEKRDLELQTVRTEPRKYPKHWDATYTINVRVKDSIAFFSGTLTAAEGQLWKNERVYYHVNKKGEPMRRSLFGYPFFLIDEFARAFKKEISYEKR